MHEDESVESRTQVIYYDASAFGQPLEPADRWRLQNIEDTKKYKASEKSFPSEWNRDEGDELSGDFVNHDKLRIFLAGGAGHLCGGGDADQGDGGGG
jgi:hypothetical protein